MLSALSSLGARQSGHPLFLHFHSHSTDTLIPVTFNGLMTYLEYRQMPLFPYNPKDLSPDSWTWDDAQTSVISEGTRYQQQGGISPMVFSSKISLDFWPSWLKDETLKTLWVFFLYTSLGNPGPCLRSMVIYVGGRLTERATQTHTSVKAKLPLFPGGCAQGPGLLCTASSLWGTRQSYLWGHSLICSFLSPVHWLLLQFPRVSQSLISLAPS